MHRHCLKNRAKGMILGGYIRKGNITKIKLQEVGLIKPSASGETQKKFRRHLSNPESHTTHYLDTVFTT